MNRQAELVPVRVVELLDPSAVGRLAGYRVGDRVEVDLTSASPDDASLAARARALWASARTLWTGPSHGTSPSPGTVLVRVPLVTVRQVDSRDGRADLAAELAALDETLVCRPLAALCDADPDWAALTAAGADVVRDGDRATVTVQASQRMWPLALGGVPCPGELARAVTVEVSHARWRDRRVRRLVALRVTALERWPDPTTF